MQFQGFAAYWCRPRSWGRVHSMKMTCVKSQSWSSTLRSPSMMAIMMLLTMRTRELIWEWIQPSLAHVPILALLWRKGDRCGCPSSLAIVHETIGLCFKQYNLRYSWLTLKYSISGNNGSFTARSKVVNKEVSLRLFLIMRSAHWAYFTQILVYHVAGKHNNFR